MVDRFPIIIVPEDACDRSEQEPIGSKYKFWFHHPELGVCLYKQPRSHTGEDWTEKIAAELCELMGLPHARYELATWMNQFGTVSPSFLPDGGSFIPGNQFLAPMVLQKVDLVLNAIGDNSVNLPLDWRPPVGIQRAVETFVGLQKIEAFPSQHMQQDAVPYFMLTIMAPNRQSSRPLKHSAPQHYIIPRQQKLGLIVWPGCPRMIPWRFSSKYRPIAFRTWPSNLPKKSSNSINTGY